MNPDVAFRMFMITRKRSRVERESFVRSHAQGLRDEYDTETDSKIRFMRGQTGIPRTERQLEIAMSAFDAQHRKAI